MLVLLMNRHMLFLMQANSIERWLVHFTAAGQLLCCDSTARTTLGVFQVTYDGRKFYYVTEKGKQVSYPKPLDAQWKKKVDAAAAQALIMPVTRSRPPPPVPAETDTPEIDIQQPALKCARVSDHITPAMSVLSQSYWEQTESRILFGAIDDDETVRETLKRHIDKLCLVNASNEGWRTVIIGHDPDDLCSGNDIFEIRQRCIILCRAYIIALEKMDSSTTWEECCSQACNCGNAVGITLATNYRVVQRYNIPFRSNEMFPHPNASARLGRKPERFLSLLSVNGIQGRR
jgi:hypothetical protein